MHRKKMYFKCVTSDCRSFRRLYICDGFAIYLFPFSVVLFLFSLHYNKRDKNDNRERERVREKDTGNSNNKRIKREKK